MYIDSNNPQLKEKDNDDFFDELTKEERIELEKLEDPDEIKEDESPFATDETTTRYLLNGLLTREDKLARWSAYLGPKSFKGDYGIVLKHLLDGFKESGTLPEAHEITSRITLAFQDKKIRIVEVAGLHNTCRNYYDPGSSEDYYDKIMTEHIAKQRWQKVHVQLFDRSKAGNPLLPNLEQYALDVQQIVADSISDDTFATLNGREFLEYCEDQSTEWIIDNWLPQGVLIVFHGREKLGKSTVIFSLIPALMTGDKWLGKVEVKQCPVLLLDFENPASYARENLMQYVDREKFVENENNFITPKRLPPYLSGAWLKQLLLKSGLAEHKRGVVIIDTARAAFQNFFSDVTDWENKQSEVRKVLAPIQQVVRELGWTAIVIHHENKSGSASGSTDWRGASDLTWEYKHVSETERRLKPKGRLLAEPEAFIFKKVESKIEIKTASEVRIEKNCEDRNDQRERILAAIPLIEADKVDANNTTTRSKIAEATGLHHSRVVGPVLEKLVEADIVQTQHHKAVNKADWYWRELAINPLDPV
ncbi:AAA family ATPase [Aeoliella sp.]|uniref:AAA family ATPase n=1 Tax=Aeoliella sp. TaxID=2795800 RepID=UPI003CCC2B40